MPRPYREKVERFDRESKAAFPAALPHHQILALVEAIDALGERLSPTPTLAAWDDDSIQFPRLLAEIMATQDNLDLEAIAVSMDLTVARVSELFDRADDAFERMKGNR